MRIAIYDLDGTLLSGSTFTPFLIFAARRLSPWRLVLLPLWVGLMLAHKLKLLGRTELKQRGMRLMVGRPRPDRLAEAAAVFAQARLARLRPGARRMIEQDGRDGCMRVIATAAYSLYAEPIAAGLDIEHVVATCWAEGTSGPNCYGSEKLARVERWLAKQRIDRRQATVRFVSDSFADAPTLDWADEAWFLAVRPALVRRVRARGWQPVDFTR